MYEFKLLYPDGLEIVVPDVERIVMSADRKEFTGKEILEKYYSMKYKDEMYLYSAKGVCVVNCSDLRAIKVKEQD